jgi:hypothetical protein
MLRFLLLLLCASSLSLVQAGGDNVPDHIMWNSLLGRYVTAAGVVNYTAMKADVKFDQYLLELEGSHPDASWSMNERKAYWINAYNAYTVKLVTDNMPLKSIKDIEDPWDKKFIDIEGNSYSLNQIEHEILRPKFSDPRVHFAINCASISCPRLAHKAYSAKLLDQQLEQATRSFVNNKSFNTITASSISLSPIFDWFKEDFELKGGVNKFINRYSSVTVDLDAKISYTDYDWGLNGK